MADTRTRNRMLKGLALGCSLILGAPAAPAQETRAMDPFRNCGVAANVAEARGAVVCETDDGRSLALINALDCGKRAYVVVVDIDSADTRLVYAPDAVRQAGAFGSMLSANGRFYTGRGKTLLEFDPDTMQWTYHDKPSPASANIMSFTESDDGAVIWAGMHPTCALIRYDAATRTGEQVAILDPQEDYPQSLALDDQGWVYAGIGTARCNLVAYHVESGEVRQLLPEAERTHGTGVVRACVDGSVTGTAAGKHYRLYNGTLTPYADDQTRPVTKEVGSVYYGRHLRNWPDGRELVRVDLPEKFLVVKGPDGVEKRIDLQYDCDGASLTSVGPGPDNDAYASSSHPMHLVRLEPDSGAVTDLGGVPIIGGGNFCSMATDGTALYGVEYAGGRLWRYDPRLPWQPGEASRKVNGIPPADIVKNGTADNGHFTHLKSHDVAFLFGDSFGAQGRIPLQAKEKGSYYVDVAPFRFHTYCRIQFGLDDEAIGEPFDPRGGADGPAPQLSFGPFELDEGAHTLQMTLLETPERKSWASIVTARLRPADSPATPLVTGVKTNPEILAQWKQDICRPRAALFHPDDDHVLMAGYAGYGLCGGGIGVYQTSTGEAQLLQAEEHLVDGHSAIALTALADGTVIAGTSIHAPGGGHPIAKEGELLMLTWPEKTLAWHGVPVPGVASIVALAAHPNGKVYGIADNRTLFEFDPESKTTTRTLSLQEYGPVPRHALQLAPNGQLYALMQQGILSVDVEAMEVDLLAKPPQPITAGGALVNSKLCYASGAILWTYDLSQ